MKSDRALLLILAVTVEILLLTLADWQLARMHQKQRLAAAMATQQAVTLTGQWDTPHTIALDNQPGPADAVGRRIITPLVTASGTVLVDRGWQLLPSDPAQPPDFSVLTPTATTVSGHLAPLPIRHNWLPAPEITVSPRVLTFLLPTRITSATVGTSYLVAQTPTAANLTPLPLPVPDATTHASYALQWLVMALVFPLCCWAAWRRK